MTVNPENRAVLAAAVLATLVVLVATTTLAADSAPSAKPTGAIDAASSNAVISPQTQADALHFVIAADRELYFQMYLAHAATAAPSGQARENWEYPADVLRRSAESIQRKGAEFSYALRSMNPINPRNGPQTELEKTGLAFVASHPTQTYYGREMLGGREYVTAVYPDLPAVAACIACHSQKSASAPRYKVGESLGGIVVRIPLEL